MEPFTSTPCSHTLPVSSCGNDTDSSVRNHTLSTAQSFVLREHALFFLFFLFHSSFVFALAEISQLRAMCFSIRKQCFRTLLACTKHFQIYHFALGTARVARLLYSLHMPWLFRGACPTTNCIIPVWKQVLHNHLCGQQVLSHAPHLKWGEREVINLVLTQPSCKVWPCGSWWLLWVQEPTSPLLLGALLGVLSWWRPQCLRAVLLLSKFGLVFFPVFKKGHVFFPQT